LSDHIFDLSISVLFLIYVIMDRNELSHIIISVITFSYKNISKIN